MAHFLATINWETLFNGKSIQEAYNTFIDTYRNCCYRFIRTRRARTVKSKPPWWSPTIARLTKRKFSLFRRSHSCQQPGVKEELISNYKETCKLVERAVSSAKQDFERRLVQDSKKNPKLLYSYLNSRFLTKESIVALKDENGAMVSDRAEICDKLNTYFHSVFEEDKPVTVAGFASLQSNDQLQE